MAAAVKAGDVYELTLPMTVEKKVAEGQGVYFQCGPLLYSYAIPQQMTEDNTEYECMHGKKPENPDFKCWNITPTGEFNYAYTDDGQPLELTSDMVEEVLDINDNPSPSTFPATLPSCVYL